MPALLTADALLDRVVLCRLSDHTPSGDLDSVPAAVTVYRFLPPIRAFCASIPLLTIHASVHHM